MVKQMLLQAGRDKSRAHLVNQTTGIVSTRESVFGRKHLHQIGSSCSRHLLLPAYICFLSFTCQSGRIFLI